MCTVHQKHVASDVSPVPYDEVGVSEVKVAVPRDLDTVHQDPAVRDAERVSFAEAKGAKEQPKWRQGEPGFPIGFHPELDYKIEKTPLGIGSNATVHHARWIRHDKPCPNGDEAASSVFKVLNQSASKQEECLEQEVCQLMAVQQHPNIIRFYGAFCMGPIVSDTDDPEGPPRWAMQLEYCDGEDLYEAVKFCKFSELRARGVMKGLLAALAHMHERGLVHRDVKPENVMLEKSTSTPKLTDFGLCTHLSNRTEMVRRCGSLGYVAPEVWLGKEYGVKVDVFAAGGILFFIIAGSVLFTGRNVRSVARKTVSAEVDFSKTARLAVLSDNCKEFMQSLLAKDVDVRPEACDALCHSWLMRRLEEVDENSQMLPARGGSKGEAKIVGTDLSTSCGSSRGNSSVQADMGNISIRFQPKWHSETSGWQSSGSTGTSLDEAILTELPPRAMVQDPPNATTPAAQPTRNIPHFRYERLGLRLPGTRSEERRTGP